MIIFERKIFPLVMVTKGKVSEGITDALAIL